MKKIKLIPKSPNKEIKIGQYFLLGAIFITILLFFQFSKPVSTLLWTILAILGGTGLVLKCWGVTKYFLQIRNGLNDGSNKSLEIG